MKKRKKIRNKIVLHPVMTLFIIAGAIIVISGILRIFNVSSTYNLITNKLDYTPVTEAVTSLFNLRGVKYIFSNTVSNFANFTVLSHLIIVLLGIGIMEYTGFLKNAVGLLTKKAKKKYITFAIVLFGILASIIDNLPFVALIPLAALIFKQGKRNPNIGIIASFASLTCGYGLSILLTSVDSSLAKLTTQAAQILDTNFKFGTWSCILIMAVAIIFLSIIITYITENYIAKKLPTYEFKENEVLEDDTIDRLELRGLIFAGIGCFIYLLICIYNIIPGLPFSGNFLNYSENLYIDKLFGAESFFANGFVFVITMLFIILGLLYGLGAKTIKNNKEFIESLGYSLNGVGKTLLLIFASSVCISIFKQTNIGNVLVVALGNLINNSGFSGLALVILLFVVSAICTIFVPNSLQKWTILSSSVVPTFINVGISGEFAQVVFRFGECVTLGLTPLFSYFIIYLAYLDRYNQEENNVSLSTSIKYQRPYSLATGALLLVIIILWYIIGVPLGIGGTVGI